MKTLLKGGTVYTDSELKKVDVLIDNDRVFEISADIPIERAETVIHCDNCFLIPGLIDVHVHFREPGFEYKETIATGSAAAAAGGYTTVCTMPNLDPAPWDLDNLDRQLIAIDIGACIRVVPYGRITGPAKELYSTVDEAVITHEAMQLHRANSGKDQIVADLENIAGYVVAFSDDGAGVQDDALMEEAMIRAKALGKIIVAHSEDTSYPPEDPRSEWKQLERDLDLVRKTGVKYHVCHLSTKESVDLIRRAKAEGLDVTCETAPHYLVFSEEGRSGSDGGRFKMNPPLRSEADRQALINGIIDGTIDMIATDHAPHSVEEKSKGFEGSLNGIIGLETAFPVMYTALVEGTCDADEAGNGKVISFERLMDLMSTSPARRFGLEGGAIEEGAKADIAVVDLNEKFEIDPGSFSSKGRSTPFEGMVVRGRVIGVIKDGIPVE